MTRKTALAALAVVAALATAVAGTAAGSAAVASPGAAAAAGRGTTGHWTKVSTGVVAVNDQPSLVRTANRELHLVYADAWRGVIRHSTIRMDGSLEGRSVALGGVAPWSEVVPDPVLLSTGGDGLQVLFGGRQGATPPVPYYNTGRMYAVSSDNAGTAWALNPVADGQSHEAHSQDGTAATNLTNGTPVAGFTLNNKLIWHSGLSDATGDQSYTAPTTVTLSHPTFVRNGTEVWAGWLQHGATEDTTGFFAMRILPSPTTPVKAPGSSVGTAMVSWPTRTPMAVSTSGAIFEAYCVGAPACTSVRLWQVGTTNTVSVPHSRSATTIGLSTGPLGRMWVAWADSTSVHAVSTDPTGLRMGAVQTAGMPPGGTPMSLAINGIVGRGDIVLNAGNGMWHTQVFPGLTLTGSVVKWKHGAKQKVVFTATNAGTLMPGATVRVGRQTCLTASTGTCVIRFPKTLKKGKRTAHVIKSGYGSAALRLKVR